MALPLNFCLSSEGIALQTAFAHVSVITHVHACCTARRSPLMILSIRFGHWCKQWIVSTWPIRYRTVLKNMTISGVRSRWLCKTPQKHAIVFGDINCRLRENQCFSFLYLARSTQHGSNTWADFNTLNRHGHASAQCYQLIERCDACAW